MDRKSALIFALLLITLVLAGCAYNHQKFPNAINAHSTQNDFLVQVDDFGRFWDPSEAERALARISQLAKNTNVIAVAFVHGWNHDAAPDNQNLLDFQKSIEDTRRRLIDPTNPESSVYRESRKNLTGI